MFNRLGLLFAVCGVCFVLRPAEAQITIEGEISVRSIFRDNVFDFTERQSIGTSTTVVGEDDAHFTESQLNLNFAAALSGKITVVAGIQSNFLWGLDGASDPTDTNYRGVTSDSAQTEVRQAYVEFKELFNIPQLTMTLGLQDISYDLRGDGNEFFLHTGERENRRWLTADTALGTRPVDTSGIASAGFGFAPTNADAAVPHIGDGQSSTAGALKLVWDADPFFLDVFYAVLEETGVQRDDHEMLGIVVDYLLAEDSIVRSHLLYVHDEGKAFANGTISFLEAGFGVSYVFDLGNPLEVYGEFGYQFGDFGTNITGLPATPAFAVDHSAYAFNFGVKYSWENVAYAPWLDVSYWHFTGDGDATDADNEAWIPYGDIDDTMIFEENQFGLGVGSGYSAWKVKAGFKPSVETSIKFAFANFTAAEDRFRRVPGAAPASYDDTVGQEIDILYLWNYTEDVTFRLGAAFFAAEGFLDGAVDGDPATDNIDAANALMFDFGMSARF